MGRIELDASNDHADELVTSLRDRGFAVASIVSGSEPTSDDARVFADTVLRRFGQPIQVFDQYPRWRPIGVRLEQDRTRSQGVGASPLHMDFVNAATPPDIVVLYCARADPNEGGATLLAPTGAIDFLPERVQDQLRQPVYGDGQVVNLHNIGHDINPFAVSSPGAVWHFRYTGQLLHSELADDFRDAVRQLDEELRSRLTTFVLEPGDALLIDQHRMVHGRGPLGTGQESLDRSETRLLWQRFVRAN